MVLYQWRNGIMLETLKEINPYISPSCKYCLAISEMCIRHRNEQLRTIAIKWIKELEQGNQILTTDISDELANMINITAKTTYNPIIQWIMHFFNITEEELK